MDFSRQNIEGPRLPVPHPLLPDLVGTVFVPLGIPLLNLYYSPTLGFFSVVLE